MTHPVRDRAFRCRNGWHTYWKPAFCPEIIRPVRWWSPRDLTYVVLSKPLTAVHFWRVRRHLRIVKALEASRHA